MKKTLILRAVDLVPNLSNDHDGVPFRWLSSLVEKVRTVVPDDEEATCMVRGAAGLTFEYVHTLSPLEELQARLEVLSDKAAQIRTLIPREGGLTEQQTQMLRELIG